MSFTSQFFTNKPLDLLLREGVHAGMLNRFKLGRTLDEVYAYGCDLLLSELAIAVCAQAGMDDRLTHLATTSFSLPGHYVPDSDEHAIVITHGYAKDHRPDLQQAVVERMVAQDGGGPVLSKSWDGNASETQIFQERAQALRATLRASPSPRSLVADATLYTEDHAPNLAKLGFITRMPGTLKLVTQGIPQALRGDTGQPLDAMTRSQRIALCHYGMAQRWLVVWSQASRERAEARVNTACPREAAAMQPQLFPLQARRFETQVQAQEALAGGAKKGR